MSLKILYVDDEPELCEAFVDNFSSPEIMIVAASSSETAVAEFSKQSFDIVFFDYRLPGTTGDKLAQRLNPKCPTFLITGEISVATEFQFTQIVPKPYRIEELQNIVNRYQSPKI